jgi:triosephosphate isomerase
LKIIAANFKTNHTRKSSNQFIQEVNQFLVDENITQDVFIFPPATALDVNEVQSNLNIGAQNAYPAKKGSFTGEIGTEQLDEFSIKTILIGHSERRHILKESQELIVEKYNYYKELGYKIIYCIGEPLEVKNEGVEATLQYCFDQLEGIDLSYENLVIAYEPVWAIGTGVTATEEDIVNIHGALKQKITKPILYGGSVKLCGLEDILNLEEVDGVLVGTASWIKEDFIKMIYIANKLNNLKEKISC